MTVDEILDRMSSAEITEWKAYLFNVKPYLRKRAEQMAKHGR
jgi:hypothetical protein